VTAASASLILSAVAALVAVPAGVFQSVRASSAQRAAAVAATQAGKEATAVAAMEATMVTLKADNDGYRNELRQQRAEHQAALASATNEYRQRLDTMGTSLATVSARAEQAWERAMACEGEREALRRLVATLRRDGPDA